MQIYTRALLFISIIALLSFSACTSENQSAPYVSANPGQALPIPEFPLVEIDIANALEEAGLPWKAKPLDYPDGPTWRPHDGTLTFTLYKDASTIGFLRSSALGEKRGMHFVFLVNFDTPMDIYTPSEEYWGNIMVFVTLLYGGFASKNQVLHYFNNEFDAAARYLAMSPTENGQIAIWEKEVNGVYFHISTIRPYGKQNEYFLDISVVSDRLMRGGSKIFMY
jgi:hypothetical protein